MMPNQAQKSLKTPQDDMAFSHSPKGGNKIVVWVPCLKTTMQINEKDFNPEWMIKPK